MTLSISVICLSSGCNGEGFLESIATGSMVPADGKAVNPGKRFPDVFGHPIAQVLLGAEALHDRFDHSVITGLVFLGGNLASRVPSGGTVRSVGKTGPWCRRASGLDDVVLVELARGEEIGCGRLQLSHGGGGETGLTLANENLLDP
jgi:hypothetical protein